MPLDIQLSYSVGTGGAGEPSGATTQFSWGTLDQAGSASLPISAADGTYGPQNEISVVAGVANLTLSAPSAQSIDVDGTMVEIRPSVMTVASASEFANAIIDASLSGKTIEMRPGSYSFGVMNGWHDAIWTSQTTIRPTTNTVGDVKLYRQNNGRKDGFRLQNTGASSSAMAKYFRIQFETEESGDKSRGSGAFYPGIWIQNRMDLVFEECLVDGNLKSWSEGGNPEKGRLTGIQLQGKVTGTKAVNCVFRNLCFGVYSASGDGWEIDGCEIYRLWGDCFYIQGGTRNAKIRNNFYHSPIGDYGYLHQDSLQTLGGGDIRNLEVAGNIWMPGPNMHHCGPTNSGLAGNNQTLYFGGNSQTGGTPITSDVTLDLTLASSNGCAYDVKAIGAPVTVTVTVPVPPAGWNNGTNLAIRRHPLSTHNVNVTPDIGVTMGGSGSAVTISGSGHKNSYLNIDKSGANWRKISGVTTGSTNDGPTFQGWLLQDLTGNHYDYFFHGNILIIPNLNGLNCNDHVQGVFAHNTIVENFPRDQNGDGAADAGDGKYSLAPDFGQKSGNDMIAFRSVLGSGVTNEIGAGSFVDLANHSIPTGDSAGHQAAFEGFLGHNDAVTPTRAEVASILAPRVAGPLDNGPAPAKGAVGYWDFQNGRPHAVTDAPAITALLPVANATGVSAATALELTVSQPWFFGSGKIRLRRNGNDVALYDAIVDRVDAPKPGDAPAPAGTVYRSGNKLVIVPSGALSGGSTYSVRIDAGAVVGLYGQHLSISNDTTWSWQTI